MDQEQKRLNVKTFDDYCGEDGLQILQMLYNILEGESDKLRDKKRSSSKKGIVFRERIFYRLSTEKMTGPVFFREVSLDAEGICKAFIVYTVPSSYFHRSLTSNIALHFEHCTPIVNKCSIQLSSVKITQNRDLPVVSVCFGVKIERVS